MSVKWMAWVWKNSPLKGTELLIHLALADYAGDEGLLWPLHSTVAEKCKCERKTVANTISKLRGLEMIETDQDRRDQRTSSVYRLLDPSTPTSGGSKTPLPPDGNRLFPPTGTPSSPPEEVEPSVEPSEEPSVPPPPADILPESDPQPEIERVPLDEGGEEVGAYRSRPKWQTIPAWAMKYASLFGRKYFKDRSERSSARELRDLLSTDMISEQWVETVAEWGTKPRSDGVRGTRWSYSGFLNVATDQEKYHDWEIRRANATGSGGDNPPDGTDLEAIDAKY